MSSEPEKLAEGTLISHLLELRDRLLKALIAVGIAFVPCIMNANDLFSFVSEPLLEKLPKGSNLILGGKLSEVSAEEAYTVRAPRLPSLSVSRSHAMLKATHHSCLRPWCGIRLPQPRSHGAEKVRQVRSLN